jgi:hypothetical protein
VVIGCEVDLAQKAAPVVADIEQKLGASQDAVHSDGTGWPLDGRSAAF